MKSIVCTLLSLFLLLSASMMDDIYHRQNGGYVADWNILRIVYE